MIKGERQNTNHLTQVLSEEGSDDLIESESDSPVLPNSVHDADETEREEEMKFEEVPMEEVKQDQIVMFESQQKESNQ